jgi:RNA polymerase sigma-70 factor (ECF subfamily)
MEVERPSRARFSLEQEPAFEELFKRYYPLLYRLAYRYSGQPDEADDIVQEVFLRFYRLPLCATREEEQRAWLCRVTINVSLNARRASKRRQFYEEKAAPEERDSSLPDPEELILVGEQAALVRAILAELPERQQRALLLRGLGLSYAEIAAVTGVLPASVGSLLARAEHAFHRRYHERTASHPSTS